MMKKEKTQELYTAEVKDFLESIAKREPVLKGGYFLDTAEKYFLPEDNVKREIFVLGTALPEEIFAALGLQPTWILGGSLRALEAANADVPRDTDAVSQSILGCLKLDSFTHTDSPTVIVPMVNDSLRKIVQQLDNRGTEVIGVDIPCVTDAAEIGGRFTPVLNELIERLSVRFRARFSNRRFLEAYDAARLARAAYEDIRYRTSGSTAMFLANTYYYTNDRVRWCQELKKLAEAVSPPAEAPRVCLMGSPVFAPNFKVPDLAESSGLTIVRHFQAEFRPLSDKPLEKGRRMLRSCAENFYTDIYSSSRLDNKRMAEEFRRMIEVSRPDGIIYVVLKGHIGFDFDLRTFEIIAEEHELPFIRIETDYNNNDIEQLRIRLEAFSEILHHRVRLKGNSNE